jgi:hypothetical protein
MPIMLFFDMVIERLVVCVFQLNLPLIPAETSHRFQLNVAIKATVSVRPEAVI